MFVKRKPSRIPPGRKDRQIYVPHKQMQIVQPPLEIRTKADALFYYNELKRLGYIQEPADNNAIYADLTSSDGTYIEFNQDGSWNFTGNPLEEGAILPAPDPNIQYVSKIISAIVINFESKTGVQKWIGKINLNRIVEDQIGDMGYDVDPERTVSKLLANVKDIFFIPNVAAVGQYFPGGPSICCSYTENNVNYIAMFPINEWRINLTPAQTIIRLLLVQ